MARMWINLRWVPSPRSWARYGSATWTFSAAWGCNYMQHVSHKNTLEWRDEGPVPVPKSTHSLTDWQMFINSEVYCISQESHYKTDKVTRGPRSGIERAG